MKLLLLISALFVATAVVVAVPVETVNEDDSDVDVLGNSPVTDDLDTDDVTDLINDMRRLHESASDVIQQVEATLSTLDSLMPHSINKRQTSVSASVDKGPLGTSHTIGVDHTSGDTTYSGAVSKGPAGTNYGAGISHKSGNTQWDANVNRGSGGNSFGAGLSHKSGNTQWDANVSRGSGGNSFGVGVSHTFNNGQTSIGANVGRNPQMGNYGGFSFTHNFGRKR